MAYDDTIAAAREVLEAGQWTAAREGFTAALAERESADAHDGMGTALWWLGQVRESLEHRERAYEMYCAEQRRLEAAVVALDIGVCYLSNLDHESVARGWFARAERVAAASGDDQLTPWIWLMNGYTSADLHERTELLTRALHAAQESGDVDLELVALADLGLARVETGAVADGLALLDEAMAGTLGGEWQRLDTVVWTSCSMLAACSLVGDIKRAAQWCGAADRFMETYGCPFLQARCRSHYGRVLVATGSWALAETELGTALSMAADCGSEPRVEALAGLAELRLRQGLSEQAEVLLVGGMDRPDLAVVTARVLLARGHPDRAVAVLQAQIHDVAVTDPAYPSMMAASVDAHLAVGDIDAARETAASLEQVVVRHQHPQAAALSARASGLVAEAGGLTGEAARLLRSAAGGFDVLDLPFEAGSTRLDLAGILAGSDPALAVVEAGRALDLLARLGATQEAAKAAALLRSLGVATRAGPRDLGRLSQRERDVLALVQRGLTNPQIGARLFISPRTVGHHVSGILTKLDLSTRAEAAAYAAEHTGRDRVS